MCARINEGFSSLSLHSVHPTRPTAVSAQPIGRRRSPPLQACQNSAQPAANPRPAFCWQLISKPPPESSVGGWSDDEQCLFDTARGTRTWAPLLTPTCTIRAPNSAIRWQGSDMCFSRSAQFYVHPAGSVPSRISSSIVPQPEPSTASTSDGVPPSLQNLRQSPVGSAPHSPQKDDPEPPVGTIGLSNWPSLLASCCGAIFFRFVAADPHLCDHSVQRMRTA